MSNLDFNPSLQLSYLTISEDTISDYSGDIQTHDSSSITYGSNTILEYPNRIFFHQVSAAGEQSIPDSTETLVDFTGPANPDNSGEFTFTNSRFTNTSGVTKCLLVIAYINYNVQSGGCRMIFIAPNKAAATATKAQSDNTWAIYCPHDTRGIPDTLRVSSVVVLAHNEYFEIGTYQDSGTAVSISTDDADRNDKYSRLLVAEL